MAPALTNAVAAPPVKGAGGVDPTTVPLPLDEVPLELVLFPLVRVKLAQVKRVALLVWKTMDRLPKKLAGPWWVERYRSRKLPWSLVAWSGPVVRGWDVRSVERVPGDITMLAR